MFDFLYVICRHLFMDAIKQWSGCQKYELFQRQSLLLSDLTSPIQEEKMKIKQFVTMDKLHKNFVQLIIRIMFIALGQILLTDNKHVNLR